jgi:hypothetical protein
MSNLLADELRAWIRPEVEAIVSWRDVPMSAKRLEGMRLWKRMSAGTPWE